MIVESLPESGAVLREPAASDVDIAIGYTEPAFTVLHQVAHLWLPATLAADRWMREGFASHAAAQVATALDVDLPFDPERAANDRRQDAFPLISWGAGQATAAQERYADAAAWAAVDDIAAEVGEDSLRLAWQRMAAGLDGYRPPFDSVPATPVAATVPADSRHLLDQLDAVSEADVVPTFRRWILDAASVGQLPARREARLAYGGLEATAGDWGVPDPVRLALAGWRFDDAQAAIAEATDWLADRDALLARIATAGLVAPERLRAEYERGGGSQEARRELDAEGAVVAAYVAARERAAADRSPLEEVGLLGGRGPDAMLTEAQSLFADGDLVGAADLSASASHRLERAATDGVVRLAAVLVLAGVLLHGRRPPGAAARGDWHGPLHCSAMTRTSPARSRFQTAADVLSGETADVYFERARRDPGRRGARSRSSRWRSFASEDAILCGAEESLAYLREILGNGKALRAGARRRVAARRRPDQPEGGRDADHGPLLGLRPVRDRAARHPVASAPAGRPRRGASWTRRHRSRSSASARGTCTPSVADQMDYASVVGGCIGVSTPAGARMAGLAPTGTMPHALILIFGDTVRAVEAFDRHMEPDVPRIALVDTFKDEAEESVRVADALGERLWGVRLDTPAERGRVTADLVKEVRARLDQAGHEHVRIVVSGGLDTDRIGYFKEAGAPVDSFAVGIGHQRCQPHRLHRRPQGDRRPPDRQARPHPGTHRQPAPRADRPQRLSPRPWIPTSANRPTSCSAAARSCWTSTTPAPPRSCSSAAWLLEPGKASIVEALARAYFDQGAHDSGGGAVPGHRSTPIRWRTTRISASASSRLAAGRRGQPARRHLRMAVFLKPDNEDYQRALRRLDAA